MFSVDNLEGIGRSLRLNKEAKGHIPRRHGEARVRNYGEPKSERGW